MKKTAKLLALLAIIGLGFTSCKKDEDPTMTTPTIAKQGEFITQGDNWVGTFFVSCEAPAQISEVTAQYLYNAGGSTQDIPKANINSVKVTDQSWSVVITFPKTAGGKDVEILKITATTSDKGNYTGSFTVQNDKPIPPVVDSTVLSAASNFTLGRPGTTTNPETKYGITWTSNLADGVTASFSATHVILTQTQYDAITTKEKLEAAYTAGTSATKFEAQSDAKFSAKYMIVKDGTLYRLVKMTDLKFVSGANVASFTERH